MFFKFLLNIYFAIILIIPVCIFMLLCFQNIRRFQTILDFQNAHQLFDVCRLFIKLKYYKESHPYNFFQRGIEI